MFKLRMFKLRMFKLRMFKLRMFKLRMFKLRMLSSRNCWLRKVCWLERRGFSGGEGFYIGWIGC